LADLHQEFAATSGVSPLLARHKAGFCLTIGDGQFEDVIIRRIRQVGPPPEIDRLAFLP
jgi:hypothetical protein